MEGQPGQYSRDKKAGTSQPRQTGLQSKTGLVRLERQSGRTDRQGRQDLKGGGAEEMRGKSETGDRTTMERQSWQESLGRKDRAGRLEKTRQDSWGRTTKTGPSWQDKQDSQDKVAMTGQLGQDNQDWTSVAGQL